MVFGFFKKKKIDLITPEEVVFSYTFTFNESGILYPYSVQPKTDLDFYWQALEQEGYADLIAQQYVLLWDEFYQLVEDEDHQAMFSMMQVPKMTDLRPMIRSENALSDGDFKISLAGWCDIQGVQNRNNPSRQGAILTIDQQNYLLSKTTWELIEKIREFSRLSDKTKQDSEQYWGKIRRLAKNSNASMDEFLNKTVVLTPETLQLNMRRQNILDDAVVEIQPIFEEAPNTWLDTFDQFHQVQDHYSITLPDGGIAHIVIDDKVKNVLTEIKKMPKRRVVGERAERFLKNPYAQLGEDATSVIQPESFEQSKQDADIFAYDLTIQSQYDEQGFFQSAKLILDACTEKEVPSIQLDLQHAEHASRLIENYIKACQSKTHDFYWAGYEVILSPKTQQQLEQLRGDLQALLQKKQDELAQEILDIDAYGDRVTGIGLPPAGSVASDASGEVWIPVSRQAELFEKIKPHIDSSVWAEVQNSIVAAEQSELNQVDFPYLEQPVSMADAKDIEYRVAEYLRQQQEQEIDSEPTESPSEKVKPSILLIKNNIDDEEYITSRSELLNFDFEHPKPAVLPKSFRVQEFQLKQHQHIGIAWLQNLFNFAPINVNGCLLADDMGLGKTIQLLCFIGTYLEQSEHKKPILIVAPVSLLENWQAEVNKFFTARYGKVLALYGEHLKERKLKDIPQDLQEKGIKTLLQDDWRGEADIVLTTYETLRDLQVSLGREHWSMMICDEAQKIKTPNALVTQAAKAMNADFKIACTGTPVENSLADLWCLFDFIQAGLLGSLKEFGQVYKRPIEDEEDGIALQKLRDLIQPQTLRRMKSDVADLPEKSEQKDCKRIPISPLQRQLYQDVIANYENVPDGKRGNAMLQALHTMRMICAHPLQLDPKQPKTESPKVEWLLQTLTGIQKKQEKVIIFTEFRDIQTFLQRLLRDHFGLNVYTVNGETKTSSRGKGESRQQRIDTFQYSEGFNVIIMSPVAVGFGVNVQKANHVIHYTRCWNPAKEDQATDRAYRIGQEKEVFVYYPSIYAEFETFEIKLDRLLADKRKLATDMLRPASEINIAGLAEGVLSPLGENEYTPDWAIISRKRREECNWTCQSCKIQLDDHQYRRFLHVHHINGQKHDNSQGNLRVLCIHCHAEQKGHEHMKNQQDYFDFLQLKEHFS